jgi:hypothetical protein
LSKRDLGQTNETQRHFNEWPISELHGEVDSIQTSLKLHFYPPAIMECRLCFSALVAKFIVSDWGDKKSTRRRVVIPARQAKYVDWRAGTTTL